MMFVIWVNGPTSIAERRTVKRLLALGLSFERKVNPDLAMSPVVQFGHRQWAGYRPDLIDEAAEKLLPH